MASFNLWLRLEEEAPDGQAARVAVLRRRGRGASFSGAARRLDLSVAAGAKLVTALERSLGCDR